MSGPSSSSSSAAASSTLPPRPPMSQLTEERFFDLRISIESLKNAILSLKGLEHSAAILARKIFIDPFLTSIKDDLGYSVLPIEEALDVLMTQHNTNLELAAKSGRQILEEMQLPRIERERAGFSSKKNQVSNLQEEINDAEQRLHSTNEKLGCLPENPSLCEDSKRELLSSASASIVESLDRIMSLCP